MEMAIKKFLVLQIFSSKATQLTNWLILP